MRSRVKYMGVETLPRVSHAALRAPWAAVAGRQKACATSSRGGGAGGGKAWVGVLFCHECFETSATISDGNEGTRRGKIQKLICDEPKEVWTRPESRNVS